MRGINKASFDCIFHGQPVYQKIQQLSKSVQSVSNLHARNIRKGHKYTTYSPLCSLWVFTTMQLIGCKCGILVSLRTTVFYFSDYVVLSLFVVDAMKRVEEIKAKRQNQFIINRFVFL